MEGLLSGGLGGGVLLGVLALLWVAVLAPSWARRRQFRAAEQNAARLQRTLRVLVETAAVPEEHRVEATAKAAVAHERMVRRVKRREVSQKRAEVRQIIAAERQERRLKRRESTVQKRADRRRALQHPRLKPVRVLSALLLITSVAGVLVGAGLTIARVTGAGALVLPVSGVTLMLSLAALVMLAPGKQVTKARAVQRVAPSRPVEEVPDFSESSSQQAAPLDVAHAAHLAAQQLAARERERARAIARARERAPQPAQVNQTGSILLREADAETAAVWSDVPEQPAANAESAPSASVSSEAQARLRLAQTGAESEQAAQQRALQQRLRAMGVVGDTAGGMTSLDEALKRRRSVS